MFMFGVFVYSLTLYILSTTTYYYNYYFCVFLSLINALWRPYLYYVLLLLPEYYSFLLDWALILRINLYIRFLGLIFIED